MRHPYDPNPWYIPERDGPFDDYVNYYIDTDIAPLFKGYKYFQVLWEKGYFVSNSSVIRIVNGVVEDQHYEVIDKNKIRGMKLPAHSGKPGIHDPRDILTDETPCWEAQHLEKISD